MNATPPPLRVFVNYRRQDAPGHAGRLYDALSARFGEENVFIDVDAIEPGLDFAAVIEERIRACDALVAVIGPRWTEVTDRQGRRRLDNPDDYVRLEIEAALDRDVRVIPVLVEDAEMPSSDDLPSSVAAFARRNALDISAARWRFDVGRLVRTLESVQAGKQELAVADRAEAERAAAEAERAAAERAERDAAEQAEREREAAARREAERAAAAEQAEREREAVARREAERAAAAEQADREREAAARREAERAAAEQAEREREAVARREAERAAAEDAERERRAAARRAAEAEASTFVPAPDHEQDARSPTTAERPRRSSRGRLLVALVGVAVVVALAAIAALATRGGDDDESAVSTPAAAADGGQSQPASTGAAETAGAEPASSAAVDDVAPAVTGTDAEAPTTATTEAAAPEDEPPAVVLPDPAIPVSARGDLALTDDALVVAHPSGRVVLLDRPALTVRAVRPHPDAPSSLAVSGRQVLVAGGKAVVALSAADLAPRRSGAASRSTTVAANAAGDVVALRPAAANTTSVCRVRDTTPEACTALAFRATGLGLSPDGKQIFVLDGGAGAVTPIRVVGGTLVPQPPIPVGPNPHGEAVLVRDQLLVPVQRGLAVVDLERSTAEVVPLETTPTDVWVDRREGVAFAALPSSGKVAGLEVFDDASEPELLDVGGTPYAITGARRSSGAVDLFVLDAANGAVVTIDVTKPAVERKAIAPLARKPAEALVAASLTARRAGDQVIATIRFRGGVLTERDVFSTDASPADGRATLEVWQGGIAVEPDARRASAGGAVFRIQPGPGHLTITVRSSAGAFERMRLVRGPRTLALELTEPPPPPDVVVEQPSGDQTTGPAVTTPTGTPPPSEPVGPCADPPCFG